MTPTDEQLKLLDNVENYTVALAGPGTGKTTTIVEYLSRMSDAEAAQTVLLTFTTAGANEFRRRMGKNRLMYAGTTHAYCYAALRRHGNLIGFRTAISLISPADAAEMLDQCCVRMKYGGQMDILRGAIKRNPKLNPPNNLTESEEVAVVYHTELISNGLVDFDSMLSYGAELFKRGCPWRPHTLVVDEVQDSDLREWEVYRAVKARTNLLIGDADQSIFEWNGACPTKLLEVCSHPKVAVFTVTKNFRSGPNVCAAATSLIGRNSRRKNKPVVSARDPQSDLPDTLEFVELHDHRAQLRAIVEIARTPMAKDLAVLCRWNALARDVRAELRADGIKVVSKVKDAKDLDLTTAISFLSAHANPMNDHLVKILLSKLHSEQDVRDIQMATFETGKPLITVCKSGRDYDGTFVKVKGLSAKVPKYTKAVLTQLLKGEVFLEVCGPAASAHLLKILEPMPDDTDIQDFMSAMTEEVAVERGDGVFVSSIHGAKGMEFDNVILPGWSQELFPSNKPIEEERRIAFVGVTRARHRVIVMRSIWASTYPERPPFETRPSTFIAELQLNKLK